MTNIKIPGGVVHAVPADLQRALRAAPRVLELWAGLTTLARNEWLCWIENAKREPTRIARIARVGTDLLRGKRRPCCWPGCPHR